MERELYRRLYLLAYDNAKGRRTKHVVFSDHKIVMVYLWAVLHDRPVSWACRAESWPASAHDQWLPSPATMSRRLRRSSIQELLDRVEAALVKRFDTSDLLHIDAKPMPVGKGSKDPEARPGYGSGRIEKGYKLHAICSGGRVPIAWDVRSMNQKEQTVAPHLIGQLRGQGVLVGDNQYDSNTLYDIAGQQGWQLFAPRRKGKGLGHRRHSPWRLIVHQQWSAERRRRLYWTRAAIERFFGQLGNIGFGLSPLPNWVRSLRRVRKWVQGKLILHMMRLIILDRCAA